RAGVVLELDLVGLDDWLPIDDAELIRLAAREAIRNVKRHSGVAMCRMNVDLSDCPFVLRVRDWGGGISGEARPGSGIVMLTDLASAMGCDLRIRSQPGLGTELILTGRRCPYRSGTPSESGDGEVRLRSVVAEESLGSRKRVAPTRPI
ncbi:MAG: hypothetical protein ACRD3W_29230, partial [Terriglobales bacterium]